jgi:hypothetical protein
VTALVRRGLNIFASLVVPLIPPVLAVVLLHSFNMVLPETPMLFIYAIGVIAGFSFLVCEFGIWSLAIALVYCPAMFYLIIGIGLFIAGAVYHIYL